MKPTNPHFPIVLIVALVLGACGSGPSPSGKAAKQSAKAPAKEAAKGKVEGKGHAEGTHAEEGLIKLSDEEARTAGVRVETISEQEVADALNVTATIQANQDKLARLSPRVPGRVVKVDANLGDRVRAGQVLATLDSLEVGEARSAHTQAQSEASVTQANLERAQRLQAEQIVSQKDFLRARAEHEKARAALRAAADKLRMLGVPLGSRRASDSVSLFALVSPFSGTVIEKKAVLGELAQPDKPLFAIADLSTVWIEANLMEQDLARVKAGDDAFATVDAYPNERFKGRLTYVGSVLDRETRTIRGRIEVANADGRLKPEMFATASIQTRSRTKALIVPEDAIVLVSGQATVFVEEHGGFEPRPIETGARLQGRAVVKSGLKADELVVVAGAYALKARMLKSQIGEGHAH